MKVAGLQLPLTLIRQHIPNLFLVSVFAKDKPIRAGTVNDTNTLNTDILDSTGNVDHEQLKVTVEKVLSGLHTIQRLTPEGERGRIKAGRVGVESAILVGTAKSTDQSSREKKAADERALERYAKQKTTFDPPQPCFALKVRVNSLCQTRRYS